MARPREDGQRVCVWGGVWQKERRLSLWLMDFQLFVTVKAQSIHTAGKRGKMGSKGGMLKWRGLMLFWFMTGVINAQGYYPLEKPWPLDWSSVLLHVWQARAIWPPFVSWRRREEGVIVFPQSRKYLRDAFIMTRDGKTYIWRAFNITHGLILMKTLTNNTFMITATRGT